MSIRALFRKKANNSFNFTKSIFIENWRKYPVKIFSNYKNKTKQNEPQHRIGIGFLCCQCFIVSNYALALAKSSGIFNLQFFSKQKSPFRRKACACNLKNNLRIKTQIIECKYTKIASSELINYYWWLTMHTYVCSFHLSLCLNRKQKQDHYSSYRINKADMDNK